MAASVAELPGAPIGEGLGMIEVGTYWVASLLKVYSPFDLEFWQRWVIRSGNASRTQIRFFIKSLN